MRASPYLNIKYTASSFNVISGKPDETAASTMGRFHLGLAP